MMYSDILQTLRTKRDHLRCRSFNPWSGESPFEYETYIHYGIKALNDFEKMIMTADFNNKDISDCIFDIELWVISRISSSSKAEQYIYDIYYSILKDILKEHKNELQINVQ